MIEPSGPESPPTPKAAGGSRITPRALVAAVLAAALVGGAIAAGVTLGVVRLQARSASPSVGIGLPVAISDDSAMIGTVQKALPAVVSVIPGGATQARGSGFLVSGDGYIVTNVGVVANAKGLSVVLPSDGKRHDARLVDYDCATGAAVLKVDQVSNQPSLSFADSSGLKAGQSVVAVSGSLSSRPGAERSIVSSLHRALLVDSPPGGDTPVQLSDLILIDARVDPTSSGAPLLSTAGQVVGVTMAVPGRSDGVVLASAEVQPAVEQIIAAGSLQVASLEARGTTVTAPDVALHGGTAGERLTSLDPGGPAARAGLRAGDVITQLDDQKLDAAHPLVQLLRARYKPNQKVTVSYLRGGQSGQLQLTLVGEHPTCR